MGKYNECQIAKVLTQHGSLFSFRRWIVVPNVYFGWGLDYEADLIAVSTSGYATEVEIKTTASDLRKDQLKWKSVFETKRWRRSPKILDSRIKNFYYAFPKELLPVALEPGVVPDWAGLITIYHRGLHQDLRAEIHRPAKKLDCRRCSSEEIFKLLRLGVMRYWSRGIKE